MRKAVDPARERELALLKDTEDIVTQARLDKIERQSKSIGALLGRYNDVNLLIMRYTENSLWTRIEAMIPSYDILEVFCTSLTFTTHHVDDRRIYKLEEPRRVTLKDMQRERKELMKGRRHIVSASADKRLMIQAYTHLDKMPQSRGGGPAQQVLLLLLIILILILLL